MVSALSFAYPRGYLGCAGFVALRFVGKSRQARQMLANLEKLHKQLDDKFSYLLATRSRGANLLKPGNIGLPIQETKSSHATIVQRVQAIALI